jgi:5-methyltetrahydrofolate--homocysteine methyltransferase
LLVSKNGFYDECQTLWRKFWSDELDSPIVAVTAPKPGIEVTSRPVLKNIIETLMAGNINQLSDQLLAWSDTHEFFGGAIPYFHMNFGADHFSALIGGDIEWHNDSPDTTWSKKPFISDINQAEISFKPQSEWWEKTVLFLTELCKSCEGRVMICPPSLTTNLDCLCAVRGTQELLMDMVMNPDGVKQALGQVNKANTEIAAELFKIVNYDKQGSITRHGMFGPGRAGVLQCDFSAMISPEMFEEFVVPCLKDEAESYDYLTYHLDGPDAIRHLEHICSIDKIEVIQWIAGSGEAAETDWTDLHEKIDSLGRGQIIWGTKEYMSTLSEKLKSKKVYIVHTAQSFEEAEEFIETINS